MSFARLLAKSTLTPDQPDDGATLAGHTELAIRTAQLLAERATDDVLRAVGLPDRWRAAFGSALIRAACLHDLGKANDHFQAMVRHTLQGRQGHRHELLSFWLGDEGDRLGEWLFGGVEAAVRDAALAAVIGHHLKFDGLIDLDFAPDARLGQLRFFGSHPDFAEALRRGRSLICGLGAPPALPEVVFDESDVTISGACQESVLALRRRLERDRETARFAACVRSAFIAADVSASIRFESASSREMWLGEALATTCRAEELEQVARKRLGDHIPRNFQVRVAEAKSSVALVRAGCGTGKTVAAYLWAARRASGRKLLFCYPTTGTATEGFADYALDSTLARDLVHSRATVDLARLRSRQWAVYENADDDPDDASRRWAGVAGALRLWWPSLTVCTADTVLGLLHNYRSALFAFPALVGAAFVFDEVHQYDRLMFASLCRFIEEFPGAPILVMTASLAADRRERLERAAAGRGERLDIIDGPGELETGKRYEIQLSTPESAVGAVVETIGEGGRVLWVCNTVDGCVDAGRSLAQQGVADVLLYHSRFRYEDRAQRHEEVMEGFRSTSGPAIAVTTQVCEVSLDLSADLLVSEIAAAPAMVQRLGRLNRRFDPEHPQHRPALFLPFDGPHPYERRELDLGRMWLGRVRGLASETDLARALEEVAPHEDVEEVAPECGWVDPVPYAYQTRLRDGQASLSVLLPEDVRQCRLGGDRVAVDALVRCIIPMPVRPVQREYRGWDRVGMAFVAPAGLVDYDTTEGARWVRGAAL